MLSGHRERRPNGLSARCGGRRSNAERGRVQQYCGRGTNGDQYAQSAGPSVGWRNDERVLTDACREEREDDHSLRVLAEPEQGHVGLVLVAGSESGARDAHSLDTSDDPDNAKTD